ncbi:MAG: hypothetical protein KGL03_11035, partial [Nitrospirota bacterium]|nr:hypothetical protein [Nitrospirota bacterium]
DSAPPSTGSGDRVQYYFMPLSGAPKSITENFSYNCATTIPWSPVNARGSYPPSGGFASPLHDSVCDWVMPNPIVGVTGSGVITSVSANTSNTLILPPAGAQVVISGVTGLSGPYTVSNPTANTFSIGTTYSGTYTGGGTWQILNPIASVTIGSSLGITVPAGTPVPGNGAQVTIAGVQGCTVPSGGPWSVTSSTPSTTATGGSFSLTVSGSSGTCTQNTGTWQLQPSQ